MLLNYPHPQLEGIKPVHFLFDQKKGKFRVGDAKISWEAHAQDFFQRIKSGLDPEGKIIGSITFGSRHEYPQLRTADLIVYEAAKLARPTFERAEQTDTEIDGRPEKGLQLTGHFSDREADAQLRKNHRNLYRSDESRCQ